MKRTRYADFKLARWTTIGCFDVSLLAGTQLYIEICEYINICIGFEQITRQQTTRIEHPIDKAKFFDKQFHNR